MILYAVLLCLPLINATPVLPHDHERIVGGTKAVLGELPHVVSLRVADAHICGASVLSKYRVLTAAHCVAQPSGELSVQHSVIKVSPTGNVRKVTEVVLHPKFDSYSLDNDIAVEFFKFTQNVQTVNLPQQGAYPPSGYPAVLAGWGLGNAGETKFEDLYKVHVMIYTDAECKAIYGDKINLLLHLCAGVPEGGKGECKGDDGGPLIGVDGTQHGIVSWLFPFCGSKGFPGVYTRITNYVDWINLKIQ